MRVPSPYRPLRLALALLAGFAADSCHGPGPLEVNGGANPRSFSIAVGQEVDIFLQTIGPGSYVAPPTLNGSAIEFLEVTPGGVIDPGGVTQLFHFKGIAHGTTTITFTNVCGCTPPQPSYTLIDTVTVR